MFRASLIAAASLVVTCTVAGGIDSSASAHDGPFHATTDDSIVAKPTTIQEGIGRVHHEISTKSEIAQAFYDQGLAHLHSYRWVEAARSFHQALRAEPGLAMAELGLARALEGLKDDTAADHALARARKASENAPKRERDYIEAFARKRAALDADSADREAAAVAYTDALDALIAADSADAEAWILRGHASEGPWGRGQGGDESSIPFYEGALRATPRHFGAHHYLAHTYENLDRPRDAVKHAKIFAESAPRVPHARHMYAHTLPRVGDWGTAVDEFEAANRLEEEFAKNEGLPPSHDWHRVHNLTLLGLAYLRTGKAKQAETTLREAFETEIPDPLVQSWHSTWPEYLLVQQRPEAALEAAQELGRRASPMLQVIRLALEGEARLDLGDPQAAAVASGATRKRIVKLQEETKNHPHGEALVWVATEYANVLDARRALHANPDAQWLNFVGQVGDQIAADPTFDGWGVGWLRLRRLERDARTHGHEAVAARLLEQSRRQTETGNAK